MTFRRRLEFKAETMRAALKRAGGICECHRVPQLMKLLNGNPCGVRLTTGNTEFDHIIADGLRPDNSLENCAALTKTCHSLKSDDHDKPAIAEAKRRADRHAGIRPVPRQVLLGTFRSNVKRPMTGPPVWRDSGRQWPRGPRALR